MTAAGTEAFGNGRSLTLDGMLSRAAATAPDRLAYRSGDERRTYRELDERVARLSTALQERGVGHGDRIAVAMKNRLETLESFFAGARLGAVVVPVNFRYVADEIAYVLEDSGASAVLVDDDLSPVLAEVRRRHPGLGGRCLSVGASDVIGDGAEDYEAALLAARPLDVRPAVQETDPAFIMYTSGTTGRPKGAVLSHLNLAVQSMNMVVAYELSPGSDHVWLTGLPLFHIGGLSGILPYLLLYGSCIIMPSGDFDAGEILDILARESVTGCFFVPTQWQEICREQQREPRDVRLRMISWGASPSLPSDLEAMATTFPGVPNYSAFGQTEMSPVTTMLHGEDAIRKMGSVGKPVMNVEVRIVDEQMQDVAVGDVGEIVYRGPTTFLGYWNKPEANRESFYGGWFHSGDLCRQDDEGFIYVVDRSKDMIISGGENIYSSEVEAVIDNHPEVRTVAVVGGPHPKWVETPVAFVVPRDTANPPTPEEIIAFCREHLASYKKPTAVHILTELPLNSSGKVLKTTLRDRLRAHARDEAQSS